MGFEKISDKVHLFIDNGFYDAIVGAIELPNQLLLIDTGQHIPNMRKFREKLEKETGKKFTIVILTHFHGDHTLGNQLFTDCRIIAAKPVFERMQGMKERWDAKVIEQIKERLEDKTALDGLVITLPNEELDGSLEIIDDGVKVIIENTGGHTSCSSHVYCPDYKVLFAGDNLFEGNDIYGGDDTCNPEIWLKTLKNYLTLDIQNVIPGHGKATDKTVIEESIVYMEKVKQTMKKLTEDGKSKEEILQIVYPMNFAPYDASNEHDDMLHKSTHERWFDVWIEGKE